MKILMLSGENISDSHGGAVHTLEVARSFADLNHEVLLVSPGAASTGEKFQHQFSLMKLGPVTSTWEVFLKKSVRNVVQNFKPDLIYERQLITGGFGSYLSRKLKIPLILEVNSPHRREYLARFPWLQILSPLLTSLERYQFNQACVAVGTHHAVMPKSFSGERLIGPWAVKEPDVSQEIFWPELQNKKIILVAGSFQAWHGSDKIKRVLSSLGKGDWAAVFLGGGKRREELSQKLQSLDYPVKDAGVLAPHNMSRAYSQAHVLLAPFACPIENYPFYYSPFKILEALSYGVPVVTNDYDNLKVLLDEDWCGTTLSQEAPPEQWAEALREILQRDKVSFALGQAYAHRHSWPNHVQEILESLNDTR